MGSKSVKPPPPRDYAEEMKGAIRSQLEMMPSILDAERRYIPQWQENQERLMRGQVRSLMGIYDSAIPMATQVAQRQQNAMAPIVGNIATSAQDVYRKSLGSDAYGLLSTMQNQALSELKMGRSLSPEETRQAQQASRAAMQARGLQSGNQAVALEVLLNNNMATARENSRRQYASNVYGLSEASAANAYNQYGGPMMQMAYSASPAAMINTAGNMVQGLGPQLFNAESGYNAALISSNRKEQMDAQIANANSAASITGAGLGAFGKIFGGLCWVAREVYGENNPRWLVFSDWISNDAPKWLFDVYSKHGEGFARFISNKPFVKFIIKKAMDLVVETRIQENQTIKA